MGQHPAARFSDRVADYVRFRPRYPEALLDCLHIDCGLTPEMVVADIGSGTGILTELFVRHGNPVYAVEPNAPMRQAAEARYGSTPGFHSIDGNAEATGLPSGSVDFITVGQAFHWFDPPQTRIEFGRILRPGGWVVLVWNERRTLEPGFQQAYEALLVQHGTDYTTVDHRHVDQDRIAAFYGGGGFAFAAFENVQWLDREGLAGRLRSSSYVPAPGQPGFETMMQDLDLLFDAHQEHGQVAMTYDAKMYYGQLLVG